MGTAHITVSLRGESIDSRGISGRAPDRRYAVVEYGSEFGTLALPNNTRGPLIAAISEPRGIPRQAVQRGADRLYRE